MRLSHTTSNTWTSLTREPQKLGLHRWILSFDWNYSWKSALKNNVLCIITVHGASDSKPVFAAAASCNCCSVAQCRLLPSSKFKLKLHCRLLSIDWNYVSIFTTRFPRRKFTKFPRIRQNPKKLLVRNLLRIKIKIVHQLELAAWSWRSYSCSLYHGVWTQVWCFSFAISNKVLNYI